MIVLLTLVKLGETFEWFKAAWSLIFCSVTKKRKNRTYKMKREVRKNNQSSINLQQKTQMQNPRYGLSKRRRYQRSQNFLFATPLVFHLPTTNRQTVVGLIGELIKVLQKEERQVP